MNENRWFSSFDKISLMIDVSICIVSCVRIPSNCFNDVNGVVIVAFDDIDDKKCIWFVSIEWFKFKEENCSIDQLKIFERISFDKDKWWTFNEWNRVERSTNIWIKLWIFDSILWFKRKKKIKKKIFE